jgi:protein phosphatase 1A
MFACRLYGHGDTVSSESHRVQEAGGWIDDGRVCDILAVSRAFGDREFKGEGLPVMLRKGVL